MGYAHSLCCPKHYTSKSSLIQMQGSMPSSGISKHEANGMHSANPFLQLPRFFSNHYTASYQLSFSAETGQVPHWPFCLWNVKEKWHKCVAFFFWGFVLNLLLTFQHATAFPTTKRREQNEDGISCICAFHCYLMHKQLETFCYRCLKSRICTQLWTQCTNPSSSPSFPLFLAGRWWKHRHVLQCLLYMHFETRLLYVVLVKCHKQHTE